jgi:hypothetical protein
VSDIGYDPAMKNWSVSTIVMASLAAAIAVVAIISS